MPPQRTGPRLRDDHRTLFIAADRLADSARRLATLIHEGGCPLAPSTAERVARILTRASMIAEAAALPGAGSPAPTLAALRAEEDAVASPRALARGSLEAPGTPILRALEKRARAWWHQLTFDPQARRRLVLTAIAALALVSAGLAMHAASGLAATPGPRPSAADSTAALTPSPTLEFHEELETYTVTTGKKR